METIRITVKSKEHAELLAGLAKELNFVTSVESFQNEAVTEVPSGLSRPKKNFCPCVDCGKIGMLPLRK